MKPIRKRLEEARRDTGLSWEIVEKDYILSWVKGVQVILISFLFHCLVVRFLILILSPV